MKQAITLAFLITLIVPSAFAQTFRTDDPSGSITTPPLM